MTCVIIVTWNGKNQVTECLQSIYSAKHDKDMHVFIVDNGSVDGTTNAVRKKFPQVTLIPLPKNLGFTGGNNVGIKQALRNGADYIWLLNNDTKIESNAFSITGAFTYPRVGIAGSKIYFAPGYEYHLDNYTKNQQGKVLWYAGGLIDWDNMYSSHRGVDEIDHGQYNAIGKTEFITGCSMMISKEVFEKIGFFDERFYLYLEDVDFCLRAKQMGYKLLYVPQSIIWHNNAGSSAVGSQLHQYYMTRNRMLLGFRYAPVRTKVALLREAMRSFVTGPSVVKHAIKDWFLGRYGKQYSDGTLR